jgi:selenocysteine lyase/cysteine desulfurase
LPLREGDEILLLDHAYGAVARTAAFVARERGARISWADALDSDTRCHQR